MKRKFCFITPHFYSEFFGGAETQCFYIARELITQGHEVHYVREAEVEAPEAFEEIVLHAIPQRGRFQKWRNFLALYQQMRRIRADYWYVRASVSYLPIVAVLSRLVGGQVIAAISRDTQLIPGARRIRGRWAFNLLVLLQDLSFRAALKYTKFIILQTNDQRKLLQSSLGVDGCVIRNAHPLPSSAPSKARENIVLWIGRLQEFKRPERFIKISEAMANEKIQFVMVGDCESAARSAKFGSWIERQPNVIWLGAQPPEVVQNLLERAKILVNTSDVEGFSNTFIEAWLRGTVLISLRVDPDGLLTEKGLGGLAPTTRDAAEKIGRLIGDEEARMRISQKSWNYAVENFSVGSAVEWMLDYLESDTEAYGTTSV